MNASEAGKLSSKNAEKIKIEKALEDGRMAVIIQEKVDKQILEAVDNGKREIDVNYHLYDSNIKNLKDRGFTVKDNTAYYTISW